MKLYKILDADGCAPFSGFKWPLPVGKRPGKWVKVKGKLRMCRKGLHICKAKYIPLWVGWSMSGRESLYEVEAKGESIDGGDKLCVRQARLVKKIGPVRRNYGRLYTGQDIIKEAREKNRGE